MQTVVAYLQQLARQRAGSGAGPLIGLRELPAGNGQRVAHLPLLPVLAQAWATLTGEPFRPHQAAVVSVTRRGEPLALVADDPTIATTAHLLLYDTLLANSQARALYLLPDRAALMAQDLVFARLDELVPNAPRRALIDGQTTLRGRLPQLLLTTPDLLHGHILRYHDRAWYALWGRLAMVLVSDAHRYEGVAAAHVAALLLRLYRICAAADNAPQVVATAARLEQATPALEALTGGVYRVIPGDDGPRAATTLLIWRAGSDRLRSASGLASSLDSAGYQAAVLADELELAPLRATLGDTVALGSVSAPPAGQVLIVVGMAGGSAGLRRALASGHEAVVVLLGDSPLERLLLNRPDLLLGSAVDWLPPPANAYVDAQHLLCAASELPLSDAEVAAWHVDDLVERLQHHGRLARLPGNDGGWQPLAAAGDPYSDFSLFGTGSGAAALYDEQGQLLGEHDPAQFDRWAFLGATLPPTRGGLRVVQRDDDGLTATLRVEPGGRRCYPLRRCTVSVREERTRQPLKRGQPISWGRVLVEEQIYGYRETRADGTVGDVALNPPLSAQWTAPAWWVELQAPLRVEGQLAGWCLAATLPLRTNSQFGDMVPCYDPQTRRLYMVEAQPGGNGLATWLFANADALLPLAYDTALACRGDALLDPIGRIEMDWLLLVLGTTQPRPESEGAVLLELPARRSGIEPRPEPARPEARDSQPEPAKREPRNARVEDQAEEIQLPEIRPQAEPLPLVWEEAPAPEEPPPAATDDEEFFQVRVQPPPGDDSFGTAEDIYFNLPEPKAKNTARSKRPSERSNRRAQSREHVASSRGTEPSGQTPPARPVSEQRTTGSEAPARPAAKGPAPQPASERRTTGREAPARPTAEQPAPQPVDQPQLARREQPVEAEPKPDAAAMIERMRRLREQREASNPQPRAPERPRPSDQRPVEPRFRAGELIFCLPFGDGQVRESRIVGDRELLTVVFHDHGEIEIDPSVSLVRKLDSEQDRGKDEE